MQPEPAWAVKAWTFLKVRRFARSCTEPGPYDERANNSLITSINQCDGPIFVQNDSLAQPLPGEGPKQSWQSAER